MIPKTFPRMAELPEMTDALSWYPRTNKSLIKMQYASSRVEDTILQYDHLTNPNFVGVPRTLAPISAKDDRRAIGAFTFDNKFTSELRPEQVPFVDGVFTEMENNHGCIGEAPTGFGKTTVGCKLICEIGRPTCVVIPQGNLDWLPELLAHTDLTEDDIDFWQGQHLPDPKAKVVIAMLQSIYRDGIYPEEIYSRFGCVIFDEVHMLGSEEFSKAIRKFPAMWRLGLSATPDRRDGKMDMVRSHVGWKHVVGFTDAADPLYYVIDSSWMEPTTYDGKIAKYDPSRTNQAKRSMMADTLRNTQIAGAAYRAHRGGRRTIVFIEQIKHGERLHAALKYAGVPSNMIINYNGGVSAKDTIRAKDCPAGMILIATYKYAKMGLNIPPLDTCILAHPIWDARQAVGRILRKLPNKPQPIVIDIWDKMCPTLNHISHNRWQILKKNGAIWAGAFS